MSYDSNPALYTFEPPPNNCILCHDLDKSPAQVQIGFAGIQRGALWVPADPPPPNGVFELPATAPCAWSAVHAPYTISLSYGINFSTLQILVPGPTTAFFRTWLVPCSLWFSSVLPAPPGLKYYGGWGSLALPQLEVDDGVPELMALAGIPAASGTAVSPRPLTADQTVYVFARNLDASNVHLKRDTP